MGRIRAHHLAELGVEVAAVVDADQGRSRALAGELGCIASENAEEIDFRTLDLAVFCIPPGLRAGADHRALREGAALFLEKPAALEAGAIRDLMDSQRAGGAVAGVGYMHRARATVRRAREFVAAHGALAANVRWMGGAYNVGWWRDRSASGGPFNEQATHAIDLLVGLLGPVKEVGALADCSSAESADVVAASLRFASGAVASLLYSCAIAEKDIGVDIYTAGGVVRLKGWDLDLELGELVMAGDPHGDRNGVFRDEMADFIRAVRAGDEEAPLCTLESAYQTQRVVDEVIAAIDNAEQASAPLRASC